MASEDPITDMKQTIWEFLRKPNSTKLAFTGWQGVGRTIIMRQIIDELLKQQEQEQGEEEEEGPNLFDTVIWVRASEKGASTRDLQIRIMEAMHLGILENEDYLSMGQRIGTLLLNQRFLLVLDDVWEPINLDNISSNWDYITQHGNSKVVIITASQQVLREMRIQVIISGVWDRLSEDNAWDLLCQEATDVASSPNLQDFLTRGRDSVIQCFTYFLLFPFPVTATTLINYWKSEGFFCEFDKLSDLLRVSTSLIGALYNRGLLEGPSKLDAAVPAHIRDKIAPILNRQSSSSSSSSTSSSSSSSSSSWAKRILVRCELGLEKAPNLDEWEKDDVERISLVGNEIQTLGDDVVHPPNCPHLSTLLLVGNLLQVISDNFFQYMQGLRVLDLSSTDISSLPSSVSSLTNLRLLALQFCLALETLPIPLIRAMEKLEVLSLRGSPLPKLIEASFDTMPSLWLLRIAEASNLIRLSLKGCRSFEKLTAPKSLEFLDLSSTKIGEFSDFNLSELTCLRHLNLLDTKHLVSVPWQHIRHLPEKLNWDQCSQEPPHEGEQGYCISVTDDKVFLSLNKNSNLWEKYFQRFKFSILSCNRRQQPKDRYETVKKDQFIYRKIYTLKTKLNVKSTRCYGKCLEINGGNNTPYGIIGVLHHTEFLSLSNEYITRLSHLGVENMMNLKDCRIEKCPNLQSLITIGRRAGKIKALEKLENLWIYNLASLKSLFNGTFDEGSFSCLKHVYLEYCPRLFSLFSSSIRFEKLETLEIICCSKLEKLFEEDGVLGQNVFPQLKDLCLWKLIKLKSICDGDLPALEKLRIRGCPMLQKLPLCVVTDDNSMATSRAVEIGGELEWQNNLKWEDQRIFQRLRLKVPRSFKMK